MFSPLTTLRRQVQVSSCSLCCNSYHWKVYPVLVLGHHQPYSLYGLPLLAGTTTHLSYVRKQHRLCFGMCSAADLSPVLYELPTNLDLVSAKPQIFPYINIFKINFHIINQIIVPMLLKYSALEITLYYIYMWTSPFFFLQMLSNRNLPKPYSVI